MTLLWTSERPQTEAATYDRPQSINRTEEKFILQVAAEFAEASVDVSRLAGLPRSMVEGYAAIAERHAYVERLESGEFIAAVSGLPGVWGEGETAEAARDDLRESIVDWIVVRRARGLRVPRIEGIDLND